MICLKQHVKNILLIFIRNAFIFGICSLRVNRIREEDSRVQQTPILSLASAAILGAAEREGRISPGRLTSPSRHRHGQQQADGGGPRGSVSTSGAASGRGGSSVSDFGHSADLTFRPRITAKAARRRAPTVDQMYEGGRGRKEMMLNYLRSVGSHWAI